MASDEAAKSRRVMRLGAWIDRHVASRHILLGGWVLFLTYCYPGYMSFDSSLQLEQARGLQPLTNWHPPVMAMLWKLCDAIIAGPFLMLVIQSVALLAGMFLILRRVMSERGAALAAVLILLSPSVITPMGVIWKDSQMAAFLMLGIALMMRNTRPAVIAGCVFVWLATAQRHNAAAATLPIVMLLFTWKDGLARWKRYALAAGVWLAITISAGMTNNFLADHTEDVVASLELNDIAGIIRYHRNYSDEQIRADAPALPWSVPDHLQEHVRKVYSPVMTWLDVAAPPPLGVFIYPKTKDESAAVAQSWRGLILAHPGAYLHHRWKVFLAELRVIRRDNFYIWAQFSDGPERAQRLQHLAAQTWIQALWVDVLVKLVNTPFYWTWLYFLAGIALVWLCRRDIVAFTVVLSGVACEGALFIVAPAIDYRYSHWMVTCTIVAAVYYVAARLRGKQTA